MTNRQCDFMPAAKGSKGDRVYSHRVKRLLLHINEIEFRFPVDKSLSSVSMKRRILSPRRRLFHELCQQTEDDHS